MTALFDLLALFGFFYLLDRAAFIVRRVRRANRVVDEMPLPAVKGASRLADISNVRPLPAPRRDWSA